MKKQNHSSQIIMLGSTAAYGAKCILEKEGEALKKRYSARYLFDVRQVLDRDLEARSVHEAVWEEFEADRRAKEALRATAFLANEAESIFALLYKIAESYDTGIEADLFAIPVRSEVIELFEFVDESPYLGDSRGCALFLTDDPVAFTGRFGGTVIGHLRDDKKKVIRNGEEERFLTPTRTEE